MEENVTRGLFNIDSINEASKGKVRSIDVDQLRENRLNSIYSQDDIDLLKENIEEFQLSQPLVVRIGKNIYAFWADAFVLVFSLPVCRLVDDWVWRYVLKQG